MFFKPTQGPVHGGPFDFRISQSVLLQAVRELVAMRLSILPKHIEHYGFQKSVYIAHCASTRIPTRVTGTEFMLHGALLGNDMV